MPERSTSAARTNSTAPLRRGSDVMPTYEYRCQECGQTFEEVLHMSDHETATPLCPACESRAVEQLMSSFVAQTAKKS